MLDWVWASFHVAEDKLRHLRNIIWKNLINCFGIYQSDKTLEVMFNNKSILCILISYMCYNLSMLSYGQYATERNLNLKLCKAVPVETETSKRLLSYWKSFKY